MTVTRDMINQKLKEMAAHHPIFFRNFDCLEGYELDDVKVVVEVALKNEKKYLSMLIGLTRRSPNEKNCKKEGRSLDSSLERLEALQMLEADLVAATI